MTRCESREPPFARGRAELTELFSGAMTQLLPTPHTQTLLADGDRVACQLTGTLTHDGVERSFSIAGFLPARQPPDHVGEDLS